MHYIYNERRERISITERAEFVQQTNKMQNRM